jgi:putative ABC transport system permease protein
VEYTDLLIVSDGAENASQVAKDVVRLLENRHGVRGQNAILVQNFNDIMSQMDQILSYITIFVVFVAAISLLVGGIGVMNIMLVSVTERTREIGIRKSLGARTGSILLQFLSESAIITLLGGLIGILIGVAGAFGICSLIGFTAKVSVGTVLGASMFSSAVGIFFGIYPAKKGIVADFDGIVTECTGVSGASVTEGAQLITLESSQNVKVSFDASKSDVAKLAIGQKVDITISGNKYEGL